jgi:hypothetical protein
MYMSALGLLSVVCVVALRETKGATLDAPAPAPAAVRTPEPHGAVSAPAYSQP